MPKRKVLEQQPEETRSPSILPVVPLMPMANDSPEFWENLHKSAMEIERRKQRSPLSLSPVCTVKFDGHQKHEEELKNMYIFYQLYFMIQSNAFSVPALMPPREEE